MGNSKKIYDEYIERKEVIEIYLQLKIKNDYDSNIDYSFFKVKGGWLEEAAIIDEEAKGYMIKLNELIRFAAIRKMHVIGIKSEIGVVDDISKADGILLHIA